MIAPRSAVALTLTLLVVSPDAANARLASGRNPEASLTLPVEFDIPVFNLLHNGQAHSRVGAWALKGTPTHYEPSGCKKVKKAYNQVTNKLGGGSMSVSRCFAFCSKRAGLSYFGLSKGNGCWCAKAIDASPLSSSACDSPCSGAPQDMCGGIEGTSVYNMIDCTNATAGEIKQEKAEKRKALISSYGAFNGETCGQDKNNVLQLDKKGYHSGSADSCKIACWESQGAEECHGFTYDSVLSRCTFHYDVTAGSVTKNAKASCFFKISR